MGMGMLIELQAVPSRDTRGSDGEVQAWLSARAARDGAAHVAPRRVATASAVACSWPADQERDRRMDPTPRLPARCWLAVLLLTVWGQARAQHPLPPAPQSDQVIAVQDYQDRVLASWLGQIIGNTYGLSYEFKYIDAPGPDRFPYGFGEYLQQVKAVNGAFSDDDTDIEVMYLLQMERHGITPSYAQLAQAWQYHVREKVWVANRAAVTLMAAGYQPPLTGARAYNRQWFQIDPQLVNEIWAVTAPGMVGYAVDKTRWAARITSDDFGTEPAMFYGALYAAAFFEHDIDRLLDRAEAAMPAGSRFVQTVRHMRRLHARYPDDWQAARKEMAAAYYRDLGYNHDAWRVVDANLNGACAILALLYGGGEVQATLDYASAIGFDADNQAATMVGLLGIIGGTRALPHDLLFPLPEAGWRKPYNDRYINVSRHDLPDASIEDLARRMAVQGERVILANGGTRFTRDGRDYYRIPAQAAFLAPLALPAAPAQVAEVGRPFSLEVLVDGSAGERLMMAEGALPAGVTLDATGVRGTPRQAGEFAFTLLRQRGTAQARQRYVIQVHSPNLAPSASQLLHGTPGRDLSAMRDGRAEPTYYSPHTAAPGRVVYGYAWEHAQDISVLVFNPGTPEEFGGWLTSLAVEFQDADGRWRPVDGLQVTPAMDLENSQWRKGTDIDHTLRFAPVSTRAIRLVGTSGGVERDARNGGGRVYYSSLGELAVYGQ